MRTKEQNIKWTGKKYEQEFIDIVFDDLVIRKADIKKCLFKNVHFKNCYLGFNTQYSDSIFNKCKFYGKYSSLGRPAKYLRCRFIDCNFTGLDLFKGQHFYECSFKGVMKNLILNDSHPKIKNNETVFKNCDLSDLIFDNVNIYGQNIFDNCILPTSGIQLFDNSDDKLIQRAEEICSRIDNDNKIESEIIFKRNLKQGQNPLIFDTLFLDSFFHSEESKKIFNDIIKGYELSNN